MPGAGLWHHYWAWAGSNIGAMPAEAVITITVTFFFRRPLARLWHRIVGRHIDEEARKAADSAHRIAADLFEHVTGEPHPEAPKARGE